MNVEKKLKKLQTLYVGVLADTVKNYHEHGILEAIAEKKKQTAAAMGKQHIQFLDIREPEDIFTRVSEIAECAEWEIQKQDNGFSARARVCKLAAVCQKMNAGNPCDIFCLAPLEGMLKALVPTARFEVKETLYNHNTPCRVNVSF